MKKLTGTDAFVITDLPDAGTADGVVRCARKVLQDGARTMARSRTYSWALLEQQISGASAGVNATDDRDAALRTFVDELSGEIGSGRLALDPGKGVTTEDLAAWAELDRRSPEHTGRRDDLLAAGIVAAADVAVGGVAGASVVIEGAGASGSGCMRGLRTRRRLSRARAAAFSRVASSIPPSRISCTFQASFFQSQSRLWLGLSRPNRAAYFSWSSATVMLLRSMISTSTGLGPVCLRAVVVRVIGCLLWVVRAAPGVGQPPPSRPMEALFCAPSKAESGTIPTA